MVSRIPGVNLYVQWPHLATRKWAFRGSVLDGFATHTVPEHSVRRMVVSLGTSESFGFRRLVERLVQVIPSDVEVLWQTGSTDVSGLGIDAHESLGATELADAIADADAVVAHAGAGITITILTAGKVPLLVPRSASHGEHVDNHQEQIARQLEQRQLAFVSDVDHLHWNEVVEASRVHAVRIDSAPPFELEAHGDPARATGRARRRRRRRNRPTK